MISNILEGFTDFKVSWGSVGVLTVSAPIWEQALPFIIQISMIVSLQILGIGVDLLRKKYKLKPRKNEDLTLPENKNNPQL